MASVKEIWPVKISGFGEFFPLCVKASVQLHECFQLENGLQWPTETVRMQYSTAFVSGDRGASSRGRQMSSQCFSSITECRCRRKYLLALMCQRHTICRSLAKAFAVTMLGRVSAFGYPEEAIMAWNTLTMATRYMRVAPSVSGGMKRYRWTFASRVTDVASSRAIGA